jgi:hypothetical protein
VTNREEPKVPLLDVTAFGYLAITPDTRGVGKAGVKP